MKKLNYEKPDLLGVEIAPEMGFAASGSGGWSDTDAGSGDMEITPGSKDDEWA